MRKYLLWVFFSVLCLISSSCSGPNVNSRTQPVSSPIQPRGTSAAELKEMGLSFLAQSDFAQGHIHLEQAFERNQRDPETLFYLGLVNEVLARPTTAIRFYEQYTTVQTGSPYYELLQGRFEWLGRELLNRQIQSANGAVMHQPQLLTVGILPLFGAITPEEKMKADQLVFAEQLARGLDELKGVKVAERIQTMMLLHHYNVATFPLSDTKSEQLGTLLAVEWILSLHFEPVQEDAYLIRSEAYHIQGVREVLFNKVIRIDDWSDALRDMDRAFGQLAGLTPGSRPDDAFSADPVARTAYGFGLLQEDRGQFHQAGAYYHQALEADRDFMPAAIRLKKMKLVAAVDHPANHLLDRYLGQR